MWLTKGQKAGSVFVERQNRKFRKNENTTSERTNRSAQRLTKRRTKRRTHHEKGKKTAEAVTQPALLLFADRYHLISGTSVFSAHQTYCRKMRKWSGLAFS